MGRRPSARAGGDGQQFRVRIWLAMAAFAVVYLGISGRLVVLALMPPPAVAYHLGPGESVSNARPDILDRTGTVLATDIMASSAYIEPHRVIDIDETIELVTSVFPDLNAADLRRRLAGERRFAWVRREITPSQRTRLHSLGIPGLGFTEENQRVYPAGRTAAHVLGHVNIDNQGIAGFEKHLDDTWLGSLHAAGLARLTPPAPVSVSVDLRVQHAIRDELASAMERFKAIAAAAVVLDAHTGEVAGLVSLPDYDPHQPREALEPDRINRITAGVYELGSTFKAFTVAMALDSGKAGMASTFDASRPIRVGGNTISDFRGKNRVLTLPEVFTYSSNIGTARMALAVGLQEHQEFLRRLGFFDRLTTELPESGSPIVPARWREVTTMTASFGHGISVSPLSAAAAAAALVNGGYLIPPTFARRSREDAMAQATPVLKPETSAAMRHLMRLNVASGTARQADVKGYRVGGKTGSAEKVVDGRYARGKLLTSFMGVFPSDEPRYVVLVMLDEPQGIPETHGFRTSGWNATPTTARIIERIAPLLGVPPVFEPGDLPKTVTASY